jgi:mersacidin/lichenicidin family type 2 lantibiotic
MKSNNIVRALKDGKYRNSLSKVKLAQIGENPAGLAELDESTLEMVAAAASAACFSFDGAGPGTFCHKCNQ